ncbi:MAG: hypothetical protein KKH22_11075 [Proteobacteria bacterium]|nr:hypothetical protein [Pseudomonadota bacterium]
MKNLRHEIPARSFINAQIIQAARSTNDFKAAIQNVLSLPLYSKQGLNEYQFENPAYIASLLYCLIVVPKELWAKTKDSKIYREIEKHDPQKFFQVTKSSAKDEEFPVFHFIRHIRNAVSHANYSIDINLTFTFWDMPQGKSDAEWEVVVEANNLMNFLSLVGSTLANEGLTNQLS